MAQSPKNKASQDEPPIDRKRDGQIVLVFQGGGALGAYQAGVYQALQEAGLDPDWVSGVSIGAINGAIISIIRGIRIRIISIARATIIIRHRHRHQH